MEEGHLVSDVVDHQQVICKDQRLLQDAPGASTQVDAWLNRSRNTKSLSTDLTTEAMTSFKLLQLLLQPTTEKF